MANVLIQNKKIKLNYEILDEYTAGMELLGFEVKALRDKKGSLNGSHITVRGGEAYLVGAHIPPYQPLNTPNDYDPYRNRRLLLTKKEIIKLSKSEEQKGLTVVPISVYNDRKIKLRLAVVYGKKKHDKRQTLKARDAKREIDRTLKTR